MPAADENMAPLMGMTEASAAAAGTTHRR